MSLRNVVGLLALAVIFNISFVGGAVIDLDQRHQTTNAVTTRPSLGTTVDGIVKQIMVLVTKIVRIITRRLGGVAGLQLFLAPLLEIVNTLVETVGKALEEVKTAPTINAVTRATLSISITLQSVVSGLAVVVIGTGHSLGQVSVLVGNVLNVVKSLVGQITKLLGCLRIAVSAGSV